MKTNLRSTKILEGLDSGVRPLEAWLVTGEMLAAVDLLGH
jgi:hypothetical protein